MSKTFKVETRCGWLTIAEKIGSFSFPMSTIASFQGATEFPSRLFAQKAIKKYNLKNAHVEEFEIE